MNEWPDPEELLALMREAVDQNAVRISELETRIERLEEKMTDPNDYAVWDGEGKWRSSQTGEVLGYPFNPNPGPTGEGTRGA